MAFGMNLMRILAPLFVCILAGVVMGRWRKLGPEPFVTAVMDLFMPALVFDALVSADVSLAEMFSTGIASGLIIALLFVLCQIARPMLARPLREFALPVLFMNAGFLGMPLMNLAFGPEGLGRIVVFDQVQSFFMFTLGIWVAAPHEPVRARRAVSLHALSAFLREPLMYAIMAAAGLRACHVSLAESVLAPVRFVGSVTPALALFALGLRLAATPVGAVFQPRILKTLAWILLFRFAGGILCGYVVVSVMHLDGLTRQVVLIASALPSAVFSYILAERYQADPETAAAAVFGSTVLSALVLPILLRFVA